MCGIVGVVDLAGEGRLPSPEVFGAMVDALARRGPDGRGVFHNGQVAFGHRRLAVLDPTTAGAQPMRHPKRDVVITFNGEIYNFRALREDLERRGHRFLTRTDTEVLVAGYVEWGAGLVGRLNGIFAFALFDGDAQRVLLARDALGVKPLFLHGAGSAAQDARLAFASEIKALLADPSTPRALDRDALDCFLTLAYVPGPLSPFSGITQLPAGHTLLLERGRAPVLERYWRPRIAERRMSERDALQELAAGLRTAVDRQLVSDVPLGAFLSGGLDSAALVSEMVQLSSERVRTFSIGFSEASFDERVGARETATLLGTDHADDVLSLDLAAGIKSIAETNDDLLADSSAIAVDRLCARTREHVTVALSGDGADELLAGYPTYLATYLARAWRRVPRALRRMSTDVVTRLPSSTARYNARDFGLRFLRGSEEGAGRDFASWRMYLTDAEKQRLVRPAARAFADPLGRYAQHLADAGDDVTLLKRMLYADLMFYLPGDMLTKVDRMSMRHGLEVRVPFLDTDLVELCLSFPSPLLVGFVGKKKHLLRQHLARTLSPRVAHRKKRGFNVPVGSALRGPLFPLFADAVTATSFREHGPLDTDAVMALARAHRDGAVDAGAQLYAILTLALFWDRWLR